MSTENVLDEIREALQGRPGQPLVLGVCQSLAGLMGQETWVVRATAIVLGVFWTLPVLIAYVILGWVMKDTEDRTRRFFSGLGVIVRESAEKVVAGLRDLFGDGASPRSGGY
jgi:phage shock protein PspC (stress-responsive transcriptional regulator)